MKKCWQCAYHNSLKGKCKKDVVKWCLNHYILKPINAIEGESCIYFKPISEYDSEYIKESYQLIEDNRNKKISNKGSIKVITKTGGQSLSDIRSESYNNPNITSLSPEFRNMIDTYTNICSECIYFKVVPLIGNELLWCFQKSISKEVEDISQGLSCPFHIRQNKILDFKPDRLSKNDSKIRNTKIRKMACMFRFPYSIVDRVASIVSRHDYWILILKDNLEYLYHKNRVKIEGSEYHLQKSFKKDLGVENAFIYIDGHDYYVFNNRILNKNEDNI